MSPLCCAPSGPNLHRRAWRRFEQLARSRAAWCLDRIACLAYTGGRSTDYLWRARRWFLRIAANAHQQWAGGGS